MLWNDKSITRNKRNPENHAKRLNNMLLNNVCVNKEIKKEIFKNLERNENENTTTQSLR